MEITVNIPDDAFCDDCPFYAEGDESVDTCNYIAIYSTDADDSELLEYAKPRGQKAEKTVKSDGCPNKIGLAAKKKLTNIKTVEIFETDDDEDEEDWEEEDED
jgi:hypothetical protein